jgi:RNA-directed DNA polymerase
MKESYNEGVASHIGPESCLDDPRGRGKALAGESTGGLLSSEITSYRKQTWCSVGECNMGHRVKSLATTCSGGVLEPGMCGHSPRGNREISGRSLDQ